jgi:Motility quorum-sensing regulator, toxin of MqsA
MQAPRAVGDAVEPESNLARGSSPCNRPKNRASLGGRGSTSHGDHRLWQDVYHVPWGSLVLYVKLTMDDQGRLILSMKEK